MKKLIAICVAVVIVIVSVVFAVKYISEKNDSDNENVLLSETQPIYPFTTGYVDGGYYINEWANIKFKITEDFPDDTARLIKENEEREDTSEDTGLLYELGFSSNSKLSETGTMFCLQFVYSDNGEKITPQKCIEESMDNFMESFKQSLQVEVSCDVSDYYKLDVLNESYVARKVSIGNTGTTTDVLFLAREHDGKIIEMYVTGIGEMGVERTLNRLQNAR